MSLKMFAFICQYIILCSLYNHVISKPMVGDNVKQAEPNEFQPVVAIMKNHDRSPQELDFICTGTLITREHVLTATHCLEYEQLNSTMVIVGSTDLRNGTKYFPVWAVDYVRWANSKNISIHNEEDDVLIIKLSVEVPQTVIIHSLASVPKNESYGLEVVTAGWGETFDGTIPQFLQTVKLTVMSNENCSIKVSNLIGFSIQIPEKFMCTYAHPYALMQYGDSGNPVFFNEEVIGVHKITIPFLDQPTHPSKINIHSSIDFYRDFILDVIIHDVDWF